ncbi:hypothetical protein ALC56_02164 [Trachymyrmex septentrionalis]|uniref:Uncharacterized protein n=1 Tax=Trachymyrmex septentrionalis TaxID=34720 RepID=A0A195FSJ9_9HYME|nr:hypothetical protein ALC56_02164 [Trachymyrmex septentrionalis]
MRDIPSRQGAMGHMDKGAGCKIGARKGESSGKKEKRKSVYELQGDGPLATREEGSSTRTGEREKNRVGEPRRDDDRMAGWLVGWLAGWMGERRRVTSAEGIELSTEAEGATSKDKLPA